MSDRNFVLVLGPSLNVQGGISAVESLVFKHWKGSNFSLIHIATHIDGNKFSKLGTLLKGFILFLFFLVNKKPQIIHIHFASRASFYRKSLFILLAKLLNRKVVLQAHGAEFELFFSQEAGLFKQRYIRFVINQADRLLVLGKYWQGFYSRLYQRSKPVIMFNPIELPSNCAPLNLKKQQLILLSLGRLSKRKGTYELLSAFETVQKTFPEARLWFGGDGDVEAVTEILRSKPWGSQVRVMGWITGEELQSALDSAVIFVLPSYNEGLPMAILNAMAHGLPVISTAVGGIPDAVQDGLNGFLITPGDIGALSERIACLLTNEELRHAMGKRSLEIVKEKFDVTRVIEQLESIYKELVSPCP